MKKQDTGRAVASRPPQKSPEPAEPTAITVRACDEITFPPGVETLGEKANFLHAYSIEASKRSTGAAILAGWVLSVARSTCAHGQWVQWLQSNVSFARSTAQNYLTLYAQTVGARRAEMRRPIPLTTPPTADELEAAAHDVDGKALSALYKSTRLIAASANWGGAGRGQGRHAKDVAAEEAASSAAVRAELSAEEGRDLIEKLAGWALGADDGFGALPDGELARAVKTLKQVLERAEEIKSAREGAR